MVAIKGMEMPSCCHWDCPLCNEDGGECMLCSHDTKTDTYKERAKDCPLVEIEEHRVGKWKRKIVDDRFNADWICTECGYRVMNDFVYFNYCPNCGADMRGEDNV